MKLWQLTNCTKENPDLAPIVAKSKAEWEYLAQVFENYESLLKIHSPEIFQDLPQAFVAEVARKLTTRAYLCEDGWLRAWKLYDSDKILSPIEVFETYGDGPFEDFMDHYATRAEAQV